MEAFFILIFIFFILLIYGYPVFLLIKSSFEHIKNNQYQNTPIPTECNQCQSTHLSPIQDTIPSRKEYRTFIIRCFLTFFVLEVIICIFAIIFQEIAWELFSPFTFLLSEGKHPDLPEIAVSMFAIKTIVLMPYKYIFLFFSIFNTILYFYKNAKYGSKEICMICHDCGTINRPERNTSTEQIKKAKKRDPDNLSQMW